MLKWVIILIAVVIITGYLKSRKAKQADEADNEEFGGCNGGCAGCANKGLCSENQNNEKK